MTRKEEVYYPNMYYVEKFNKLKHKQRPAKYGDEKVILYKPTLSKKSNYKLKVYVPNKGGIKLIYYGDKRYQDFTTHRDENRQRNYCKRSKGLGNTNDETKANFWSRMTLWNC